jgi:hypothetical protein
MPLDDSGTIPHLHNVFPRVSGVGRLGMVFQLVGIRMVPRDLMNGKGVGGIVQHGVQHRKALREHDNSAPWPSGLQPPAPD